MSVFRAALRALYQIVPNRAGRPVVSRSVAIRFSAALAAAIGLTGLGAAGGASAANESVFTTQVPASPNATDNVSYELGMKFTSAVAGQITAVRYYKAASETGTHVGRLWTATGTPLATVTFVGETASGWQQQALTSPVTIQANTTYVVSVNSVYFAMTGAGLAASVVNGDLSTIADGANGVYGAAGAFPTSSFNNTNYFRDVVFVPGTSSVVKASGDAQLGVAGTALANPLVVKVLDAGANPIVGATVTFSVTAGGGTLSAASAATDATGQASTKLTLGPAPGSNTVQAAVAGIGSVTFTASASGTTASKIVLTGPAGGTGYSLSPFTVSASLQDALGNVVATATNPVTFSATGGPAMFSPDSTIAAVGGGAATTVVPTASGTYVITATSPGLASASTTVIVGAAPANESLFSTQTPTTPNASDGVTYELGAKFTAKQAGRITAVRYWKAPSETGTHVGRVWSATGTLLASVTFANESASGWQQQALSAPLAIAANTTYVVSTNVNAYYAATVAGLAASVVNGDLASVADGANGVYGATGTFPSGSYNNSNYFRDVVFVAGAAPVASIIAKLAGDGQSAAPAATLARPLTVQVRDASGNPVVGQTVTFAARSGGGAVATASAVTDINGEASTSAKLGAAGINTFHAAVAGVGAVDFAENANAAGATTLSITPLATSAPIKASIGYTATLLDAAGYVVTGATAPITFTATGAAGTFTPASATPVNGSAYAVFVPSAAGTATVRAAGTGLAAATTTLAVSSTITPETVITAQVPTTPNATDNVAYELGMKFQSARSGQIVGIDYWKAASETGTHTGHLWSASGALLATQAFTGETASGWQRQTLSTPLRIQANTPYVVSVNANAYYAVTQGGLATSIANGDLSSVADGLNGAYGASGAFPASSYQTADYFRDVNFLPDQIPQLSKVSGDLQPGTPGAALAQPLVVQLFGADGKPLSGATVSFAVASGGGSVSPATAVTDLSGYARAALVMGPVSGRNTVTATSPNAGSVTFAAVVPNAVYLENLNPGSPGAVSAIAARYTSTSIAGYADAWSVNKGGTLPLRVSMSSAGTYLIEVFRLGWYGGAGARLMASSGSLTGVTQPACAITDSVTHLVECKWSVTYTVAVGANWTSGLYMARLTSNVTGQMHPVFFIVRDDAGTSDILFQSSRTTAYAYGSYGTPTAGYSLYGYNSTGGIAAQKVSLDRPSSELGEYSNLFNFEYPMARWLESQGYDVSYTTNMDLHTGGAAVLKPHKLFLSVGHDEYWSKEMRDAAEGGRDAGVNLGFFSGNSSYWRVRFEPSSTGVPNRVMVCYKDSINTPDPTGIPTYTWRDPLNNRPENAMMGVQYIGDNSVLYAGFDFVVANATDPLFANTGLVNGSALSKLVGYEWDGVVNNGFSPSGLVTLAASTVTPTTIAPDQPTTATQISNATRYTAASGATVFALGSIQWMWGLDSFGVTPPRVDPRAQQFAVNLLAKGGARPLNPNPGIVVP